MTKKAEHSPQVSPKIIEIYSYLIEKMELRAEDRAELKRKRGFSDATIETCRFRSIGDGNTALEEPMRAKFGEHELVTSGVFIADRTSARINPQLINREKTTIIIPYLRADGSVYHVRPHKLGFHGIGSEIYQELNLSGNFGEVIITEGEFKAAAARQYGLFAISVPGISSFSERKFPDLVKLLKTSSVKRVVIMFDNETKDDPVFEDRYKKNPNDRYDTQFYTYYMASKLEKDGTIEVSIATLPDGWKENGKIDIDGALAQGRTEQNILTVIYEAKPRAEYLNSLDPEGRQILLRKMSQKFHRAKIKKEFNKYWVTKTSPGGGSYDVPISNFILRVIATHETPDGVKREVEFMNEYGKRSSAFTVDSDAMASGDAFRAFSLSKGDFIWRGSTDDLLTLWESEFLMMDEGRYIIESDHLGWLEREKIWLFGNVAIRPDGKEIRPDQSGIFWLEKRGIKPVTLNLAAGKNTMSDGVPYLSVTASLDMPDLRKRFSETIGLNETCVLLGWVTAVAFMEEVFELYRSFPFLFVTGRWQSGKSTIAEWVTNFFGIENAGKAISQTTPVAIQRSLAYYSCLPVYLDEYRNTKEIIYKNGFLRNVYNRQSAGKGVKDSDYGLRDAKVRGTLVLAGEETPKDGALLSRCIVIFVSRGKRTVNHFNWFMANRLKFSGHFYTVLKNKAVLAPKFLVELEKWKEFFINQGIDDRMALNYATVTAGYAVVFGSEDIAFADWLTSETKTIQTETNEEQAVSVFMDDLMAMKTRKLIDDNFWCVTGQKIYLYFHGLHQVWSQEFRKSRGEEAFKESSIRAYLKEEPGFLEINAPYRIKGQMKKCVVFDLARASEDIKNLVDVGESLVTL